MELRDLRALVAVVRAGSFTVAATELGYTQSAISQQIAALEQEVGRRLVERRPVRPTAAGARLVEHAARVLLRVDVARSELGAIDASDTELRIAACPLAAPALLSAALRRLRMNRPSLRVTVGSENASTSVTRLAEGSVDLALVEGITAPDNPLLLTEAGLFSSTALVEEPLVVVLPADHPLAGRASLDLGTLSDAPWIVAPGFSPTRRRSGAGGVAYEGDDIVTLLTLVAAGHGSALLPQSARLLDETVSAVPLASPILVHRTEALTLRTVAEPAAACVAELRSLASRP
jgi:DNA-binding transcriptional LysR family regulator